MLDPSADNTDVYAFTAPDAPHSLTVVANWIPLEDPAGGPYFGKLDPRARYYVKVDNTGDGREDVAYRWKFTNKFRNPNSFLDAAPTVDSVNDPDINFVQTYDLYKEEYKNGHHVKTRKLGDDIPVAPANTGPKTVPDYAKVQAGAVKGLPGGGKTFVGPSDDPFFVDLGAVFDGINIDKPGRPNIGLGNQGGGKDDVVVQHALVRPAGAGVRGHARRQERRRHEVRQRPRRRVGHDGAPPGRRARPRQAPRERWVQVSRLGNPLINEVIIPIGQKDKFNRTSPADDLKNFGTYALNPEPARLLNALFKLGVKESGRTDIVQALLTGIPGLTQIGVEPGAGGHAEAQPRRGAHRLAQPLRCAGERPGRLPERPPAG